MNRAQPGCQRQSGSVHNGEFSCARRCTAPSVGPGAMCRRVAMFPPFIALVAALLLIPGPYPPLLDAALVGIGDTLAPLALLSVGLQLRFDALREHCRLLCLGLGYKLLVCLAIMVALVWAGDASPDMLSRVSVISAAMPPMDALTLSGWPHKSSVRISSAPSTARDPG